MPPLTEVGADQVAAAVLDVLQCRDKIPPLRGLDCPRYLRELRSEVSGNYFVVTVPKRGYGRYKRRTPAPRGIPPELDTVKLEAVFTLLLAPGIQVVAIRNAFDAIKIFCT